MPASRSSAACLSPRRAPPARMAASRSLLSLRRAPPPARSRTLLRRSGRRSQRPRRDGRGRTRKPTAVTSAPKFCVQRGSRLVAVREEGRTRRRCPRCGWTFYGNPVPAAVALVTRGGRLLLTRRARPPYAATWDLPGGFLEAGEHPAAGLRRELRGGVGVRGRQGPVAGFAPDPVGAERVPLPTPGDPGMAGARGPTAGGAAGAARL